MERVSATLLKQIRRQTRGRRARLIQPANFKRESTEIDGYAWPLPDRDDCWVFQVSDGAAYIVVSDQLIF